jgi:putative RecB family exonuclease
MTIHSHSSLSSFRNCQLKYRFKYIDKIKTPEFATVEAFLGQRVHKVLQKLYDDLGYGKLNSIEDLLIAYREMWVKEWSPGIKIVNGRYTRADYYRFGAECIRSFYNKNRPFQQSQTLGTEQNLEFSIDEQGRYQLRGVIDRIARRDDGTYEIHDYKTSKRLPGQREADADQQLALYQIGVAARWNDVERVELHWHYVRFGVTLRSSRSAEQLTQLRASTVTLIEQIESTKDFAPHKSALCNWCEYQCVCPLWKHVVKVQALPTAEIMADDGVRLADEYVQAKREESAILARIEGLRARILAFAEQQSATVLQGNGARVSVSPRDKVSFPRQDDPQRAALENFLRQEGKWDEVSKPSNAELTRVLEEEAWPLSLLKKLGAFVIRVPGVTLRVVGAPGMPPDAPDAAPDGTEDN